jgi:tyrosine-protein phosphatase SIW14
VGDLNWAMRDTLYVIDMRHLTLIFLCLAVGVVSSHAQAPQVTASAIRSDRAEKIRIPGVPNAGKVSDQLYRGAQPHIQSLTKLKEIGITTIIDLRAEDAGMRDQEKKEADRLGIDFVSIPVGGWSNPTNDEIAKFLSLFDSHSKVFVHCRLGEDRAGVFVATYRIAIQKWTAEHAISEMYYFGFNGFWHPGMISFVRNLQAQLSSVPAAAATSSPTSSSSPASSVSAIISPN